MNKAEKRLKSIERTLGAVSQKLESSHFYEYVEYVADTKSMLRRVFVTGLIRGLGMAVGFSVLGAFVIYLLNIIAQSNLPYIAQFISKIVRFVESNN